VTRFWWVRHGPTHERAMTGWRDVPADLSDTAAIARLNAHLPTASVISSDLIRATATADALTSGRQRLPDNPALREINFGDWDGKHWTAIAESHPTLSRLYWDQPGDHAPPNGESWNAAAARATAATDHLLAQHHRDLILVAHFGIILTQLARALRITPHQALSHKIDPLSVTCLHHDGSRWHADSINHHP
jgi:alpha-ribazole phosphatase